MLEVAAVVGGDGTGMSLVDSAQRTDLHRWEVGNLHQHLPYAVAQWRYLGTQDLNARYSGIQWLPLGVGQKAENQHHSDSFLPCSEEHWVGLNCNQDSSLARQPAQCKAH